MRNAIKYKIRVLTILMEQTNKYLCAYRECLKMPDDELYSSKNDYLSSAFIQLTKTCLKGLCPTIKDWQGLIEWIVSSLTELGDYIKPKGGAR